MNKILETDILTMAAATGHAACHRLAHVLGDGIDPNCWINAGWAFTGRDVEHDVQMLAAYVCGRGAVHGEQLFLKARELGLHRFKDTPFADLEPWVRTAYSLFGSAVSTTFFILQQAQAELRHEEERLRAVVDLGSTDETIQLPATGDAVAGDDAGSPIPPDAEPAPQVAEGGDAPSATILSPDDLPSDFGDVIVRVAYAGVKDEHDADAAVEETKS